MTANIKCYISYTVHLSTVANISAQIIRADSACEFKVRLN
jgi:hypothetical protein